MVRNAITNKGEFSLLVLCDGMGGLSKGEVASASLIQAFSKWFEIELPKLVQEDDDSDFLKKTVEAQWDEMIHTMNDKIANYGLSLSIQLGTTATAMLILPDFSYLIGHVGDTRVYKISDSDIEQLTVDQTFVAREVREGRMTRDEALHHPKRNMLLQCVGASKSINIEYRYGYAKKGEIYMLCCDGFRHVVSDVEFYEMLKPKKIKDKEMAKQSLVNLVEINKTRGEQDNITAMLVKL
ncbi:MAG: serine/threonine-protein phosphatase [Lachnospiraceae bacterium]|nr:serine/threonine-protein phosphatase [Lachnospiraceae bacterium]